MPTETSPAPAPLRAMYRCARCKKAGRQDAFRVTFERVSRFRLVDGAGTLFATSYEGAAPPIPCPGCGAEIWGAALECRPLDPPFDDEADVLLARAWVREGGEFLVFGPHERDGLFGALCEASNGEDATAENSSDPTLRKLGGRAARSLAALASRVLRAG